MKTCWVLEGAGFEALEPMVLGDGGRGVEIHSYDVDCKGGC